MTVPEDAWVFDTGPLRHFAAQGWLGVLRFLAGDRRVYIPSAVQRELYNAADQIPAVRQVVEADWIHVHSSESMEYVGAFSRYHDRLVADGKNVGECEVLAMGKIYGCEIVVDDAAPRRIAEEEGIRVTATVPILCDAIREQKLTTVMVEELADNLLEGKYYLPFGSGGFRQHVLEHGLLDYGEL
ncbi:hypothetical protein ABZ695_01810 [Streptomyces sp. NPDC006976]|uniref:hypothetical protein n=1 Tax=Streptomyces sp. NPDC006976 TaxID=3154311 RepID=UPI0033D69AE8